MRMCEKASEELLIINELRVTFNQIHLKWQGDISFAYLALQLKILISSCD